MTRATSLPNPDRPDPDQPNPLAPNPLASDLRASDLRASDLRASDPIPVDVVDQVRDTCLCLATQRAARLLARRFDRLFALLGLTNGQFSMLVALSGNWSPRLGELALFLAMDQARVTAAVKTLQRSELIALAPDKDDARARRPALTDTGRKVLAQATPLWRNEHRKVQALVPGQDAAALADILGQLG